MSELRFTEDHDWLRLEGEGLASVGISDFAQRQLGDLVYIGLPEVGSKFEKGADAAVIESVKAASDLKMPVGGTVVEVNAALPDDPGAVNADPLGAGWFLRIKVADPGETTSLMDEAAYAKFIESLQ